MDEDTVGRVAAANSSGKGLVVGLRTKGVKFKRGLESGKAEERESGLPFGSVTGGLVLYSDDAGMDRTYRSYDPGRNRLNDPEVVADMLAASEARSVEQGKGVSPAIRRVVLPELTSSLGKRFGTSFQSYLRKRVPSLFSGQEKEASTEWLLSTCAFAHGSDE
jgi:hypothetical protein